MTRTNKGKATTEIERIMRLRADRYTVVEIARMYGVSHQYISKIVRDYERWQRLQKDQQSAGVSKHAS